jgi:hypothetical protein
MRSMQSHVKPACRPTRHSAQNALTHKACLPSFLPACLPNTARRTRSHKACLSACVCSCLLAFCTLLLRNAPPSLLS